MIDQEVLIPKTIFNPTEEEVNINTFTISTDQFVIFYYLLKFLKPFILLLKDMQMNLLHLEEIIKISNKLIWFIK
jgi:hypothetical protein